MRRAILLASPLTLLLTAGPAFSDLPHKNIADTDPRTPADEVKAFHLPPGFEIQLVASEPDIHKPLNMEFDDRGRLWVTETVEYPFPEKDGKLKGADAVKVLEDFGPDGKARKITTFADKLDIPIGVLPLLSAKPQDALVYSIPSIWRLRDADGDGKADERTVLYTQYGHKDTHGMTGNFTWGFDGWVYACHGFSNESTVKGSDGQAGQFPVRQRLPLQARRLAPRIRHARPSQPVRPGLRSARKSLFLRLRDEADRPAPARRLVRELRQAQRRPRLRPAYDRAVPRIRPPSPASRSTPPTTSRTPTAATPSSATW